jgi:hypothetical protein
MKCSHCKKEIYVENTGPESSDVLVVAYQPNNYDKENTYPFLKPDDNILRSEMSKQGYPLIHARQVFMWHHPEVDDEKHLNAVIADLMHEMKDKTNVLMVGAHLAKLFTGLSVTEINGLEVPSMLTPKDVSVTYIYDPAMASNKALGEFRLAIQKFVGRI